MTDWFRYGLMVIACGVYFTGIARSDEANLEISDGPSRGELFEARMRADMGPAYNPLIASTKPAFYLPRDVKGDFIFGIDVSHHNDENCKCKPGETCAACKINWSKAQSQRISFVYAKASQGTRYRDPTFDYHWRALTEHKIARGAYHFMSADEDPIAQAENFLDKLNDAGKLQPIDLPPCLDLEADLRKDNSKRWFVTDSGEIRDFWLGQEPDEIIRKVLKWLKHVEEKTGRTPVIYTSRGWWNERIKDENKIELLKRYPIWIANYTDSGSFINGKPKVPNDGVWTLWQFTETGRTTDAEIVPGKLDINIFNVGLGNFEQALGVTVAEQRQVASLETPADSSKPSEQTAGNNSNTPSDTNKSNEPAADSNPGTQVDTNKPSEQVAGNNPITPADTNKPPEQTASASPNTPNDTNKPSEQVSGNNPITPADTNKPTEPAANNNPTTPADTNKPPEQTASASPNTPNDTNKPSEQVSGNNPITPADTNKPTEPAANNNPTTPAETSKPPEQTASASPNTPNDATKPPEQAASASPNPPGNAEKPNDQAAVVIPTEPKEDNTPPNQQASANPNDAKQNAAPRSSRTSSRNRTPRSSSQKVAESATPVENATADKTVEERMTVEIVLLNGRVLRVDANIDPALLARLVTAVDGK